MKKRLIGLTLCLAMVASMLTGCAPTQKEPDDVLLTDIKSESVLAGTDILNITAVFEGGKLAGQIPVDAVTLSDGFSNLELDSLTRVDDYTLNITTKVNESGILREDAYGNFEKTGSVMVSKAAFENGLQDIRFGVDILKPEVWYEQSEIAYSEGQLVLPIRIKDAIWQNKLEPSQFSLKSEYPCQVEKAVRESDNTVKLYMVCDDAKDADEAVGVLTDSVLTISPATNSQNTEMKTSLQFFNPCYDLEIAEINNNNGTCEASFHYSLYNGQADKPLDKDAFLVFERTGGTDEVMQNAEISNVDDKSFTISFPAKEGEFYGLVGIDGRYVKTDWNTFSYPFEIPVAFTIPSVTKKEPSNTPVAETATMALLSTAESSSRTVPSIGKMAADSAATAAAMKDKLMEGLGSVATTGAKYLFGLALEQIGIYSTETQTMQRIEYLSEQMNAMTATLSEVQGDVSQLLKNSLKSTEKAVITEANKFINSFDMANSRLTAITVDLYQTLEQQSVFAAELNGYLEIICRGLKKAPDEDNQKVISLLEEMGIKESDSSTFLNYRTSLNYYEEYLARAKKAIEEIGSLYQTYLKNGNQSGIKNLTAGIEEALTVNDSYEELMSRISTLVAEETIDILTRVDDNGTSVKLVEVLEAVKKATEDYASGIQPYEQYVILKENLQKINTMDIKNSDVYQDCLERKELLNGNQLKSNDAEDYTIKEALAVLAPFYAYQFESPMEGEEESGSPSSQEPHSMADLSEERIRKNLQTVIDSNTCVSICDSILRETAQFLGEQESLLQQIGKEFVQFLNAKYETANAISGQYAKKASDFQKVSAEYTINGNDYITSTNVFGKMIVLDSASSISDTKDVISSYDTLMSCIYNFDTQAAENRRQYRGYISSIYTDAYLVSSTLMLVQDQAAASEYNRKNRATLDAQTTAISDSMKDHPVAVSDKNIFCYTTGKYYAKKMTASSITKYKEVGYVPKIRIAYEETNNLWQEVSREEADNIIQRMQNPGAKETPSWQSELKNAGFENVDSAEYLWIINQVKRQDLTELKKANKVKLLTDYIYKTGDKAVVTNGKQTITTQKDCVVVCKSYPRNYDRKKTDGRYSEQLSYIKFAPEVK